MPPYDTSLQSSDFVRPGIMNFVSSRHRLIITYWLPILAAVMLTSGGATLLLGMDTILFTPKPSNESWFSLSTRMYTAAVILLSGLSLGLQINPSIFRSGTANRIMHVAARSFAAMMIFLGILSLADIEFIKELIAHLITPAASLKLENHMMSVVTAVSTIFAGWGLYRLDRMDRNRQHPAEYYAFAVAALMFIPIVGYLFNVQILASTFPSPAFSLVTPIAFITLAIGMLLARPQHSMMTILFSKTPGGRLLRSVLPATLILLVGLALLAKWGEHQGFYSKEMIAPLALLAGCALLLGLYWRAALMLNQEYGTRVKGEAELAQTNDLIRIVSDFTTDAICVKDRKGRYIFANPMALKIFGKQLDTVVGFTSSQILDDQEEAAATIEANNLAVLTEGKAHAIEFTMKTPVGLRTYHVTTAPWFGKQGKVMGTVGIATDITDRKRSEDALRAQEVRLEKLVEARTQEVRELIGHLETMREEEKRAIARELHDDMGASLTALNMHLAILFQQIPSELGMAERIVQIKALLGSVTATKRRIQNGLRPDKLDIFGIKTAITDQAQDFENYTGLSCSVSLPDEEVKYSTEVETSLFRMVQEALNNIAKHAKASQVDIILDDDGENIYLTIRDNGVGISPQADPYSRTHGLRGMRERAAYLGGSIAIDSKPGSGTRISIILPKAHVISPVTAPSVVDVPKHPA